MSELFNSAKRLRNRDFQYRDGNFPTSNIPVSIEVYLEHEHVVVIASFKSTTETFAESWLLQYLSDEGFIVERSFISQNGEYDSNYEGNDWVTAEAFLAS